MKNINLIPSEKTFINWVNNDYNFHLTHEEAALLLGYIHGHNCGVYLDEKNIIVVEDFEDPENGVIARGFDELLERVSSWNYEFLQDSEVVGSYREEIIMDMEKMARLIDRANMLFGMPMGVPTVKELIAILSKLPEDYRVSCCGGENYLYIWEKNKSITIDHEHTLA